MKRTSDLNGWEFQRGAMLRCHDHHPTGQGEQYLCPYAANKDGKLPCSAKPTAPCHYNPAHLPR